MTNKVEVNTVKPEISFLYEETQYRLLDFIAESILDNNIDQINNYLSTTNGIGKTEEQKDLDYGHAQNLWKSYQQSLRDTKFNFYLDRSQYTLLTDILIKKLEYDVNTVFIAIELTELLGGMSGTKYQNDKEIKCFQATATEITYIYHLIQNYKVKGLSKESYTFSKILIRIGDLSKVINYYDTTGKNLTEEISKWALTLDDTDQQVEQQEQIEEKAQ